MDLGLRLRLLGVDLLLRRACGHRLARANDDRLTFPLRHLAAQLAGDGAFHGLANFGHILAKFLDFIEYRISLDLSHGGVLGLRLEFHFESG